MRWETKTLGVLTCNGLEDPIDLDGVDAVLEETFGPGNVAFVDSGRCIYCNCTEDDACTIPLKKPFKLLDGRTVVAEPCHWISYDPPICSAPMCVTFAQADEVLARVSRIGA